MRAPVLASAALLTLATTLLAAPQKESFATPTPKYFADPSQITVAGTDNCPIGFFARRESPTEIVFVDRSARHLSGQGVHLSLQHLSSSIAAAEVVVHAVSNKMRYLPVKGITSTTDLSRHFHLSSGSADLRSSDLWLDDAGSILSVDLVSMAYTDGTAWKRNPLSTCHAPISGLMLIDAQPATPSH